jgi:hypothetical protein
VVGGAVYSVTKAFTGGFTWRGFAASVTGGAVSGAVAGATFGTSLVAQAAVGSAAGVAGGVTSRAIETGSAKEAFSPRAMTTDALLGGAFGAATGVASKAIRNLAPSARATPTSSATPNGQYYSVAYEMKLNPADLGRSRSVHFNRANASLDAAIKSDQQFASQMESLIPGVSNAVSKTGGRTTPSGWIWHHAQESGAMQLVPGTQHTPGSMFWNAMHPGGRGGYSIWAIPAGAPPN